MSNPSAEGPRLQGEERSTTSSSFGRKVSPSSSKEPVGNPDSPAWPRPSISPDGDLGKLWPALAVVLVGVSDHAIWVKQDFIDGEVYQDRSELDQDLADRGWVKPGPPQFTHKGTDAVIGDVKLAMSSKGWMGNRGLSMSSWNPREAFEQREAGSRTFAECRLDAPCPCPSAPPQSTKRSLDCGFTSVFSTRPFSWTASRVDQLTSRPLAGPEYSSGCDDPQEAVSWTRTAIWRGKRTFIG